MVTRRGHPDGFASYILPSLTLGLGLAASLGRLARSNILDNMAGEHIRAAIARGLPRRRVVGRHVLKNSLVPIVTILGLDFAYLMGGAVITETIFNLPGTRLLTLRWASRRRTDRSSSGSSRLSAIIFVFTNLFVDLLCAGSTRGSAMSDLLPPPESEVKPQSLTEAIAMPAGGKQLTLWGDVWRKLKRDKRFWVSSISVGIFVLMAIVPACS